MESVAAERSLIIIHILGSPNLPCLSVVPLLQIFSKNLFLLGQVGCTLCNKGMNRKWDIQTRKTCSNVGPKLIQFIQIARNSASDVAISVLWKLLQSLTSTKLSGILMTDLLKLLWEPAEIYGNLFTNDNPFKVANLQASSDHIYLHSYSSKCSLWNHQSFGPKKGVEW